MTRRLAYFHFSRSFSWMTVLAAAQTVCEPIWVIDSQREDLGRLERVLGRSGPVVDVGGRSVEGAAAAISVHRPDGILSFFDARLVFVSEVARRLGLPFLSPDSARALTDKWVQRQALERAGLPSPRIWRLPGAVSGAGADERTARLGGRGDRPEADGVWSELEFPAILKPRQGEASRDTVKVDSLAELRRELEAVERVRGRQELVLESYIPDRPEDLGHPFAGYVSVESITAHGEIRHVGITGRFPPAPPFRESGFFLPSALTAADAEAVLSTARAAIQAVGVDIGATHTEIKLTPDGPRVIEVNGRIGGGIPELLADLCDYDFMTQAVRVALGDVPDSPPVAPDDRVAYLFYVQAPPGVHQVHSITGLDQLRAEPGVGDIILNRPPGQEVDWREGNHGHVFSVQGTTDSHAALAAFARRLAHQVHIR